MVRTTPLLRVLEGEIDWLTSDSNVIILETNPKINKIIPLSGVNDLLGETYGLIINLEDTNEIGELLEQIHHKEMFGAFLNRSDQLIYTESSREWFDLSLISRFGKKKADELKLRNRKSYQELIFKGLGYRFNGEKYFLPRAIQTDLSGDVAIVPRAGSVWPMKNWAYFDDMKSQLEEEGYKVNYLPIRESLLEHIGDIQNHRILVSGDSLPMHIALGNGVSCLTLFICTSPWEIYDYGFQKKIVSPLLEQNFYKRDFDIDATTSISKEQVINQIYAIIDFNK